jgi:oxygen-independent coproporphyrinogen-3 oxidase
MTGPSDKHTALYFHWPFCAAKCPYCDFNVHVSAQIDQPRWANAYCQALRYYAQIMPDRVIGSIFFGGGTPSLMHPETIATIIEEIKKLWPLASNPEITLEANPTSAEADQFRNFKNAGINRLSIGVQALNDADLKFLGRQHDSAQAIRAIRTAADIFERYSFDLITARPHQNLESWKRELMHAVTLARGHLSVYHLTIERNTPFYFQQAQGLFEIPDDDLSADLYECTQDILEHAGLPAYEVSNHAAAGQESRHNLAYWHYQDYIGIGPGAHGRITLDGMKNATRDHSAPSIWLERVEQSGNGAHPFERLSHRTAFEERVMMGLRLNAGLSWAGLDLNKIQKLEEENLLTSTDTHIFPTRAGRMKLNALTMFLLAGEDLV